MSVVINVLAAIGLIVIISYSVYYLYKYYEHKQFKKDIGEMNPPPSYLQNVGLSCPDYWVNMGNDSNGNIICKNSFNVPVGNQTKCPSKMSFTSLPAKKTWEYGNPNGLKSLSDVERYNFLNDSTVPNGMTRCDWINNCGPSPSVQGIWQGVNEICNAPAPTN